MLHIATVATHSERYLPVLEKIIEDKGFKLHKLAFGKKYEGHFMKDKEMITFLEKLPEKDIVIFLDGFDTLMLSGITEVLEKFKKTGKKMILSTENITNSFLPHSYLYQKVNKRFINTGQYMGYCGYVLNLLKEMYSSDYDKKSNQTTWSLFLNKKETIINLLDFGTDNESNIFLNHSDYSDNKTEFDERKKRIIVNDCNKPCFVQGNGMINLNDIINKLGYGETNINGSYMFFKKIKFNLTTALKTYPIIKLYILWGAIVVILILLFSYFYYKTRKFETIQLTFS